MNYKAKPIQTITFWCAWMIGSLFFGFQTLRAENASSEVIQYRRIIIPEKDLPLLGHEFVPIDIDELQQLMAKHHRQSKLPFDDSVPKLKQALYVATLVGQDLVSEASRLTIAYKSDASGNFAISPCSLAIRGTSIDPKSLASIARENFVVDSQPFRYDRNGSASITIRQSTDFWFGWSVRSQTEQDLSRLKFHLEFPRCLDSRLILQLPPMWRIESEPSVARILKDPSTLLGNTWPSVRNDDSSLTNWWLVELSNSTETSFELVQSVEAFQLKYDHLILQEKVDYRLQPSNLEVVAEFMFAESIAPMLNLTLQTAPGLHISSIMLDEQPMEWRSSQLPHKIDIIGDKSSESKSTSQSRLVVRGLTLWPLPDGEKQLPTIQIDRAYSIDGKGSLSIQQDWTVNQVQIKEGRVVSRSGTTQLGGLGRWDFDWSGQPPKIELLASPRKLFGVADTLTRLSNEGDSLLATNWVSINANSNPRSAIRFLLSPGWTIESVQPTDRRYISTVQKVPSSELSEWEIQLTPPIVNQAIALEIRARYSPPSSSVNGNTAVFGFDGGRLISFQDFRQSDTYWIEPTGRYKIDANTELLQCRVDEKRLSESQRQRLPTIGDVWLIQPDGGKIPKLTFRKQAAPYSAQLESTITPGVDFLAVNYRLRCIPIAGAVSSVTIDLSRLGKTPIRWRQRRTSDEVDFQWMAAESQRQRLNTSRTENKSINPADSERMIRVDLQSATSEAFELEGYAEFPWAHSEASNSISLQIPLPLLPEAAQQDAILQIDNHLALVQWNDEVPWTPCGYLGSATDYEARQFRYDPIRVVSVDVRSVDSAKPNEAWLSDVVTKYSLYLDGHRELRMIGRIHSDESPEISIDLPPEWKIRQATLDSQTVAISSSPQQANRIRIWIPKSSSKFPDVALSLVLDGPQTSVRHREYLSMPRVIPQCPVTQHRYEFWLPTSLSVASLTPQTPFALPTFNLANLWPTQWYRNLLTPKLSSNELRDQEKEARLISPRADSSQHRLVWSTVLIETINLNREPVLLVVNEVKRAESWTIVFAGFSIALCLGALRRIYSVVGMILLICCMLATTGFLLETVQLIALGWVVGLILQFSASTIKTKGIIHDRSALTFQNSNSSSKLTTQNNTSRKVDDAPKTTPHFSNLCIGWAIAFSTIVGTTSLLAQSNSDKVYHIALPVDSKDQFTSKVAYISDELLQRLYHDPSTGAREPKILSARYELRLADADSRSPSNVAQLKLNYEIEIRDSSFPIIWPLDSARANFVSLRIDGSETPLGSRLKWDDRALQWTPLKRGLTHVELTIAPKVEREVDGRTKIEVEIIPLAGSQLEIEAGDLTNLQTNALGQVSNPTLGLFQVAIGPQKSLEVSWQKPEKDSRSFLPLATLETEFALLDDEVLARTNIEIDYGSSKVNRIDIECDLAWQPIGRIWGDAILMDSVPASSNTRRRYRLQWEKPFSESGEKRALVIHWTTSSSRASTLNFPNIELPGIRMNDSLIRYVRSQGSAWTFEGLQAWPTIDSTDRLEWFPRIDGKIISHRKPSNGITAFLRRAVKEQRYQAELVTQLRFLTSHVHCSTNILFKTKDFQRPDLRLKLPAGVEIETVRVNQIDVPFSVWKINEEQMQLQAFLDPTLSQLESLVVETVQIYRDTSWTQLPLPELVDFEVIDHRVSATRIVNQIISWEGLDLSLSNPDPNISNADVTLPIEGDKKLEVFAWEMSLSTQPKQNPEGQISSPENEEVHARYRIGRPESPKQAQVVSMLLRTDDRWSFHIHGRVEVSSSPIDGVLLEVPQFLLEDVSCNHRMERYASPEAGRQLIFIFSDLRASNQSFEFKLHSNLSPIESSSTTAIPEIRLMGDFEWQQWMIVPRSIANQEARWNLSGARTVDGSSLPEFSKADLSESLQSHLVVIPTIDRPSIRLSTVAANRLPIALDLAVHRHTIDTIESQKISSSFFFLPRGHKSIQILVPANFDLLAAECNGRTIPESSIERTLNENLNGNANTSLDIRLLSPSLPQQITIHIGRSEITDSKKNQPQKWPEVLNAIAKETLLIVDSNHGIEDARLSPTSLDRTAELLSNGVLDLVEQVAGFVTEAPLNERLQWWKDWEASTAAIWQSASQISDHSVLEKLISRRLALCERLQLSVLPYPVGFQERFLQSWTSAHAERQNDVESQANYRRQYFSIKPDIEINRLSNEIQQSDSVPSTSVSQFYFRWTAWLILTAISIRITHRLFDSWHMPLQQFVEERPWWLIVGIGIICVMLAPNLWLGPIFLLIAFYFVCRTYIHELGRINR